MVLALLLAGDLVDTVACILLADVDCTGLNDALDALYLLLFLGDVPSSDQLCNNIGAPTGQEPSPTATSTQTPTPSTSSPPASGTSTSTPTSSAESAPVVIHHIDAEQGDAALIVAPSGEVAMIDSGRWTSCGNIVAYVQMLGIEAIDYHFATHYDADHIGCLDDLQAVGIGVAIACYDRGGSKDTQTFDNYVAACGAKRHTATKGQVVELEAGTVDVSITVVDLNGAGVNTSDENALGLVLKVSYGEFDHSFGGDLPGLAPYDDIESIVAPALGDLEVYKVHHHGSKYSTSDNWLNATSPEVGIVSVGSNSFGHPTAEALARLHDHGVKTYWTNVGSGVSPDPANDKVGRNIVITAEPEAGSTYEVVGNGFADVYVTN